MSKYKKTFNSKAGEPPETDDLKLINGIGPVIEGHLNKVGIFTFAQLSLLLPADIAEAVSAINGLSAQQISAHHWVGQARELALQLAGSKHQRTGEKADKLREIVPAAQTTALPSVVKRQPVHLLNLQKLEILPQGADYHRPIFSSEQLFDVRLTLDWNMTDLTGDPFDYTVSIFVKKLGVQGHRGCIGRARGTVAPAKTTIVKVEGMTLPQGTYRFDANVFLTSATGSYEASLGLSILKKSQILHIN